MFVVESLSKHDIAMSTPSNHSSRWWQLSGALLVLLGTLGIILVPAIARSQTKPAYRSRSARTSSTKPINPDAILGAPAKRWPVQQAQAEGTLPPPRPKSAPRSLAPYGGPPANLGGPEEDKSGAVLGTPKPMPVEKEPEESATPSERSVPGTSGRAEGPVLGAPSPVTPEASGSNPRLLDPAQLDPAQRFLLEDGATPGITLALGETLIDPSSNDPHLNPILAHEHFELGVAKLSPYKKGFFQKLSLSGAFLGSGHEDNLNMTELESFAMFGLPFPITEWPLVVSPGYNMHLLSRPTGSDLPPRLNDAYVDFMWLPTFVHRYTTLISVTPGYYSDYRIGDADAFRIVGKGLVIYDAVPEKWQLIGGVAYLGRDNLKILPVGGAIWTPNDYLKLELIFPKPKLAAMLNRGMGYEDWLFVLADYGGNTYSIRRQNGEHDKVTLQDFRIITGIERKLDGGAGYRLEAGYIFGRRVDYLRYNGDFEPQDTFMVRAGITF